MSGRRWRSPRSVRGIARPSDGDSGAGPDRGPAPRLPLSLLYRVRYDPLEIPRIREFRPGLVLLEARVEDFDVRSAVVVGSRRALVWDTLAHPRQMAPVAGLAEARPVTVAYSHADWDHVFGTGGLTNWTEIVAHEVAAARFGGDVPAELARRHATDPEEWGAVRLEAPTRTFRRTLTIDLGDVEVRLEALPGHTADCIVACIPSWGVLLAGDTVETPLPVVNDAAAIEAWTDRLTQIAAEPWLEHVVPAHGSAGGTAPLEETLRYLEALTKGRPPTLPDPMEPFYRETHARNLRLVAD